MDGPLCLRIQEEHQLNATHKSMEFTLYKELIQMYLGNSLSCVLELQIFMGHAHCGSFFPSPNPQSERPKQFVK